MDVNKPFIVFDHSALILDIFRDNKFLPRPFRFFKAWNRDPSFETVIQQAWNE